MTNEELVELIQKGHIEYMGDLYEQNIPSIKSAVWRLRIDNNDFDDAMQEAYFGLAEAVKRYDSDTGYKFMTYAIYYIRNAVRRNRNSLYHIPEWLKIKAAKIRRAQEQLSQQLNRTPTTAEIAAVTGFTVKEIKYTLRAVKPLKSLEAELTEDFTIADTIADDSITFERDIAEASEREYIHDVVHAMVESLPERERKIIKLYYFEGWSYQEIAAAEGVSFQRVRRILKDALRYINKPKLQKWLTDEAMDHQVNYYKHRGLQTFKYTWTSATEQIVIERERHNKEIR